MDLGVPKVMGVLNVTPDSFYDGGRYVSEKDILVHAEKMLHEGADIIDIGGYSTRPGAVEIDLKTEMERVLMAVRPILRNFPGCVLSVDTFNSSVAKAAVDEGASIINDVSGGSLDPAMFKIVGDLGTPYILMHMKGDPRTMTRLTQYENLIQELIDYFQQKIFTLTQLGVKDILIDPGFGFAKTREQNFELLNQFEALSILGKPIVAGLSRKSMIWKTLHIKPDQALNGTSSLNAIALLKGASLLRVHDVKEAREVIRLIAELKSPETKPALNF